MTFKITALDAIVKVKLIDGTDSMQLIEAERKRMEKSNEKTTKLGYDIHQQRKHKSKTHV